MPTLLLAALLAAGGSPLRLDVPFVEQRPDFCGEAVASMALRHLGRAVSQDDVFNASGVDPAKGRGVWTDELAQALRRLGVDPGPVWYRAKPGVAGAEEQWRALEADLRRGQPSIVCTHYDETKDTTEHFRLVVGHDAATDEVIYHEPAEPSGAYRRMPRDRFLRLMAFKPRAERWTYIRLRLTPREAVPPTRVEAPAPADVAQHVLELKRTLPEGMTLAWVQPFLVVGNEDPDTVRRRGRDVVRWARDLLLKDFFAEAPAQLEEIWILKDAQSYQRLSRSLFGTNPETPFGYYLPGRHAQVMNIKPGYGTLVHELVHPFMHHAWPDAPGWLNEGLASLFEFPYEEDGHLKGRVNWRLPALQQGLAAGTVVSFRDLAHFSQDEFYDDRAGTHYAAARYLCHWLQEKGTLPKFVRRAIELQAEDPTGYRALREVLGQDPDAVRGEWETYVRKLGRRRS
jgi:hypothetical protein